MIHPIKTFLFDLGNVLVAFSHPRMYQQMGTVLGLTPHHIIDMLAKDRLQWRYECGEVTTEALLQLCESEAKVSFQRDALIEAVSDIFTPIETMRSVTRALKEQGHRLVLVSNTNELHFKHVQSRYDVLDPFDDVILSYEVKAMKPAPDFYRVAVAASGHAASDCLFVDDLEANIVGARNFGIPAVQFTDYERFRQDLCARGITV